MYGFYGYSWSRATLLPQVLGNSAGERTILNQPSDGVFAIFAT
jgi:hypothetical protein